MNPVEKFAEAGVGCVVEVGMAPATTERKITTVTHHRVTKLSIFSYGVESQHLVEQILQPGD